MSSQLLVNGLAKWLAKLIAQERGFNQVKLLG